MKNLFRILILITFLMNSPFAQSSCDTLTFINEGSRLQGYFYYSGISGSPTLLFTQGFMDTGDIWNIGKTLSENGINVFTFDFRGCFQSEGKQSLMNSQEDIDVAYNYLRSDEFIKKYKIDTSKIIPGGYSFGGHMSMLYAVYHPEIKRMLSISGGDLGIVYEQFKSKPDLRNAYSDFFESIKKPKGSVDFEYEDPTEELMENREYFDILKQSEKLANTDVLLTGGTDDITVSFEEYILPIYHALKKNKDQKVKFKVYQTNHSYKNVSQELLKDIINWIKNE